VVDTRTLAPSAVREDYEGCAAPTAIVIIDGAGHVWPGCPLLAPDQRTDVNAAETILAFLSDKRIGA
jgi:hypothetical protein